MGVTKLKKHPSNYLTLLRNTYGFRTRTNTVLAVSFAVVGSLMFGTAFAVFQALLFAAGFTLNKLYP